MTEGPKPRYEALLSNGAIEPDPAQAEAIDLLQNLYVALREASSARKFSLFFRREKSAPKGLYLWGGVGRGKTMLMDLFFNHASTEKKARYHFHEFMAMAHDRIAAWRAATQTEKRRHPAYNRKAPDDPMPPVAHDIAREARLLCFDEFQVTDVADAMILGRLFQALLESGVVVVATSNRKPGDLYKDGLNRQLFLPFIDFLSERLTVFEVQSEEDYRLAKLTAAPVYYHPLGAAADAAMDKAWGAMICGGQERSETLQVKGRTVAVPRTARGAARFEFDELCARPLGANDYLAIVRHYGAIYIDHIPIMDPDKRNEAKRFVTLIDAIYDTRAKLVCSADGAPAALYPAGDGSFEFERTASRLIEMQSSDYLAAARAETAV